MKFKQSHGQNQRFEQITTSHLVVGIDIAKETHIVQASLPIRASTCRGEFELPNEIRRTAMILLRSTTFYKKQVEDSSTIVHPANSPPEEADLKKTYVMKDFEIIM